MFIVVVVVVVVVMVKEEEERIRRISKDTTMRFYPLLSLKTNFLWRNVRVSSPQIYKQQTQQTFFFILLALLKR